MPELEESYRRLLRAYPAFYRRDRGLEILTTLMDAAAEGQTRPSRDEAAYLVLAGLRYRLVPPGRIGRIAAVLVTIWTALVLSGAGALAAWSVADPPRADLAALSDSLVGRSPTSAYPPDRAGPLDIAYFHKTSGGLQSYGVEGWTGPDPVPVSATRVYPRITDVPAVLDRAHQSLRDAGWQTGSLGPDGVFWAGRDGMLLRVAGHDEQTGMMIDAYPVEPGGVPAGAITGFVLGLLLAWPAMTWLAHRVARAARPARSLILLAALPGLIACAVNSFDSVMSMLPDPATAAVFLSADHIYPLASQFAEPLAMTVVALSLLATLYLLGRKPEFGLKVAARLSRGRIGR
jgi:hypothetical protein